MEDVIEFNQGTDVKEYRWTIPYVDLPLEFWKRMAKEWGQSINAVYLPLPGVSCGSGRPQQPQVHLPTFLDSALLPLSLLINPIILYAPVEELSAEILAAVRAAADRWPVVEITVANVELAIAIKTEFPALKISASTLLDIFNPQQLHYLPAFDTLVPSTRIARNLDALQKLKAGFQGKIRMMVNEGCLPSCPFRVQHFYEMSRAEISYPKSLCTTLLEEKAWLRLTGSWILPQHLHLFEGVFDELKLAGRVALADPKRYEKVLSHYITRQSLLPNEIGAGPAGLALPMAIDDDFYQYTLTCDKACTQCTVCRDYWKRHVK